MSKRRPAAASSNGSAPAFDVEIKIDSLTWEDLYVVTGIGADTPFDRELVAQIRGLFERVVVGGAAAVPVMHTRAVIEQIGEAMRAMGDVKNSAPA